MKLTLRIVSLRLRSSIHLGERESLPESSSILPHSDTLFSAFCHGFRLLYGKTELDRLLKDFSDDSPPFRLSSAFPCWEGISYFPVPLNQLARDKDLKKVAWVEQKGWERLLAGERLSEIGRSVGELRCLPPVDRKEEEDKPRSEPSVPWKLQGVPRVGLNRLNNHPDERYFHFTQVHFDSAATLFFLVQIDDEALWTRFKATWYLLADEGIGGDRSVGKGLFETPRFETLELSVPDHANARMVLSLFYPAEEETEMLQDAWYEFIERKGYIFSPDLQSLKRQGLRLFREGSVFRGSNPLRGSLVDVTPNVFKEHRVYRYGIALSVPCLDNGGHHVG